MQVEGRFATIAVLPIAAMSCIVASVPPAALAFTESEARPTLIFVRAGTLDDSEVAQPASTIWTSQAPSWACINPDLPRVAAQPPPIA